MTRTQTQVKRVKGKPKLPPRLNASYIYAGVLSSYVNTAFDSSDTHPVTGVGVVDYVTGALRAGDYSSLLKVKLGEPQTYGSPENYLRYAQLSALIKKMPFEASLIGVNPEEAAWEKFQAVERRMARINIRHRAVNTSRRLNPYFAFFEDARRYILRVLGEEPSLKRIYSQCDFCGGANLGVHGSATNLARKLLAGEMTATPGVVPYAIGALLSNEHYRAVLAARLGLAPEDAHDYAIRELILSSLKVVDYDQICFVLKTAECSRTIAIQPLLNGLVQKGIDLEMRHLLNTRVGIDLRDQSVNQTMALFGSLGVSGYRYLPPDIRRALASFRDEKPPAKLMLRALRHARTDVPYVTIDLASASDSNAIELVRGLVPPAWFQLFMQTRVPCYRLEGGDVSTPYHKICSMGNGFCFPLETLIFAALTHAAEKHCGVPTDFRVYGDDIVLRQDVALLTVELLRWAGFRLNLDKSFFHGPFRESCGADWYKGSAVRPVYVDGWMQSINDVFALHNSFGVSDLRREGFYKLARASEVVSEFLRNAVPQDWRFMRPLEDECDTCFNVPYDIFMTSKYASYHAKEQRWTWRELLRGSAADDLSMVSGDLLERVTYAAVLRGASSEMPFALRFQTRSRVRRNIAEPAPARVNDWLRSWQIGPPTREGAPPALPF